MERIGVGRSKSNSLFPSALVLALWLHLLFPSAPTLSSVLINDPQTLVVLEQLQQDMSSDEASTSGEGKPIATSASTSLSISEHLKKLVTRFPVRDARYLSAANFFIGAALFVANGFLYIFMVKEPHLTFNAAALPVTSIVGTFCFLIGCSTGILEAMNVVDRELDGVGVIEGEPELGKTTLSEKASGPLETSIEKQNTVSSLRQEPSASTTAPAIILIGQPGFKWIPTSKDLKKLKFWGAVICWTGIIPFYISAIAYVPGVADLTNVNTYYYLALLPYCLGGCFFTIASVIDTILVQRKWYIPALDNLCWYSGLLWTVGSFGFALGGSLWYAGESQYWAATLASFWGAWCWVVGSVIRCYIIVGDY
jgi:hypothetical protein